MEAKREHDARARLHAMEQALEETLSLYHAWLAVLLMRQDNDEVRVTVSELRETLGKLRCDVGKEKDEYVIRLVRSAKKEIGDGGKKDD